MDLCKVFEVGQQGESCEGDAIVGHYRSDYPVLLLYVLHAAADAVEGQHEGLCSPETEECAEQCEVEEQVAHVGDVLLLV